MPRRLRFGDGVNQSAPFQSSGLMALRGFAGSNVVQAGQDHLTERKTMSDRLVAATGDPRLRAWISVEFATPLGYPPRQVSPHTKCCCGSGLEIFAKQRLFGHCQATADQSFGALA
jgi:hypothetical protein